MNGVKAYKYNNYMKAFVKYFVLAAVMMYPGLSYAQQQQPDKTAEEIAAAEVAALEEDLKLSASQAFYVDSILCHNYRALYDEYEDKRNSGMQNAETYRHVSEKWLNKNLEAFKLVLDEQQYIGYLKRIGKGKEYKKGKDGLYYKKEELEKQKQQKKKK
jgi:hypothetical protein